MLAEVQARFYLSRRTSCDAQFVLIPGFREHMSMIRESVYLETSAIGYATSRPSRDLVVAGRQQITREWFASAHDIFELFVSDVVIDEISQGDSGAARERIEFSSKFPVLESGLEVGQLARRLVDEGAVPRVAGVDALHVSVAAVRGVHYLLTWNCRHIANATKRKSIELVCRSAGFEPPMICTPEELYHGQD